MSTLAAVALVKMAGRVPVTSSVGTSASVYLSTPASTASLVRHSYNMQAPLVIFYISVIFIYLFIYLRTQHSKQYKIEDTIKAAKF